MVSENLTSLNGKSVEDYDVKSGIKNPQAVVYRLRVDYDAFSDGENIPDMLASFTNDPKAAEVEELIIGSFDFDGGDTQEIVNALVASASKLPKLKILFIGDITYEENEISWINQCDVSPVLKAYPALEYFRVRGGNDLSFGKSLQHAKLKFLIIESGGLPPNVINEVVNANLPSLEHLELWLGSANYGFESSEKDLAPLFAGKAFSKLRYLGLRDSEISDDLAKALENAPILNQLETLDLSMGTLGDEGAKALLNNPSIKKLRFLDLHHHYISKDVCKQLKQIGITVNLDDSKEEDEDGGRYVEVSE